MLNAPTVVTTPLPVQVPELCEQAVKNTTDPVLFTVNVPPLNEQELLDTLSALATIMVPPATLNNPVIDAGAGTDTKPVELSVSDAPNAAVVFRTSVPVGTVQETVLPHEPPLKISVPITFTAPLPTSAPEDCVQTPPMLTTC